MTFTCRICREKFVLSPYSVDNNSIYSDGYSVVTSRCGHLFHSNCLEGALTNQKLLHAQHGTGPLRKICPVANCNTDIPSDDSLIKLLVGNDGESNASEQWEETGNQDTEVKLIKRIQLLQAEKERLTETLEKADIEIETLRCVLDEVKHDLSEVQSFLKNDNMMRKGDLIFWITKDEMYAPGKILEIRKKPGENVHYAIIKLDKKAKVSGVGPYTTNRETFILPISELVTFKSFFAGFCDNFQAKFGALLVDLNAEIAGLGSPTGSQTSAERSASYYRSSRKISRTSPSYKSQITGSMTQLNVVDELDSVAVESVPAPISRKTSQPVFSNVKATHITRSKTIHYGVSNEPRKFEKLRFRSKSWTNGRPTTQSLESPSISESGQSGSMFTLSSLQSPDSLPEEEEGSNEYIKEGERVIWVDAYSDLEYQQQLGTVVAVCQYSPCAIVQFDEHPIVKHKFQFRTVPLDELFPYDLASVEDKYCLAEIYGYTHDRFFDIPNDGSASDYEDAQQGIFGITDNEDEEDA